MSKNKEQKIKKLTKQNIWAPILFFIISVLTAFIIIALCVISLLFYTVENRFRTANADANEISAMIDAGLKRGESLKNIVSDIGKFTSRTDALVIIDDSGNVLETFGENTVVLDGFDNSEQIPLFENTIFQDSGELENFTPEGEMTDVTVQKLASEIIDNLFMKKHTDGWFNARSIHTAYWIGKPIGDTNLMVLVKCYIDIYNSEVFITFALAALVFLMLLTPLLFLFLNIISHIRTQKRMATIICTDTVTGGKNWFYFENEVAKMLEKKKNAGVPFLLIDFSLMRYRSYCACYGVKQGENLLERIDRYLNARMYNEEYCAHVGKSQFVILLKSKGLKFDTARIQRWINELPGVLGYPHAVFHAGIFQISLQNNSDKKNRGAVDVAQLYNNASAARAFIEEQENSAVEVYNAQMLEEQLWNNKVAVNMRAALANEEFEVYLQPKYNPLDDSLAGAEALVRWNSPTDGFISPGKFIPIFETNGFITKLDDYMISHVAALQAKWLAEGKNIVTVSVNVSRAHFSQPNLAEHIAELVDAYNLPHSLIEIELTESAFFDDKTALLTTVNSLKKKGFEVSMDDFGSGYSSLNTLKELPLDVLKLDAGFFRGKFEKERGKIVVSQAISLAKQLNMRIVAEGVEEKEQVDFLAGAGCDMIQGYYYAKPMPADEYVTRL